LRFTRDRDEEKLAREVYGAIGAAHPSFASVASSEQTHMDATATLLTRYARRRTHWMTRRSHRRERER